jgi:hypothetical protein
MNGGVDGYNIQELYDMANKPTKIKPHCVYCGAEEDLKPSEMVPDDTLYPGVQLMCKSHEGCLKRIHDKYHIDETEFSPDCEHCQKVNPCASDAAPAQ